MKRLQPVIWSKGTFLSPQHLQVQDKFIEDTLNFRLQALRFCPWGFAELALNHGLLADGQLAVSRAAGIFPDGLLFDIPDSDQPPPSRGLVELFDANAKSLNMYLAIPDYRQRGVNVSSGVDGGARYVAEVTTFRDENAASSDKPLQIARKNFRLLAESENRQGFSALPIANVERTEAGTFRLNARFIPPLINIRGNEHLVGLLRGLIEILAARSTELAGARSQKNQSLADFTASDIADFWLLYTINTAFPTFSHLFETRGGHPEALFSAMLQLAGSLTTFSQKVHPRDLPVYDHENLGACFTELDEKLRLLLETVVPANFVSLPLKLVQPNIYATSIDREEYLRNTRMYLAVSADTSQADLIGRTPNLVKICSGDHIELLVQRALAGVPLIHSVSPPSAIPLKLNYQYFSLSQSGGPWETIVRARNLAAYVPGDFPNPQLELIILLPSAG